MVTLVSFELTHKEALCHYSIHQSQRGFTALPALVFERIAARNEQGDFFARPITILYGSLPVGLMVLDAGTDKTSYTDNSKSLLLRALSIDERFQGKGIGSKAISSLPAFIKENYATENYTEIVLGVNIDNPVAHKLYSKSGYEDRGKQIDHPNGRQNVMVLRLLP